LSSSHVLPLTFLFQLLRFCPLPSHGWLF